MLLASVDAFIRCNFDRRTRMAVPITPIDLGDVVRLKKPHPCGVNEWESVRLGAHIGLRCQGCDRKVMLVRSEFDRRFRGYVSRVNEPTVTAEQD
jgi:hypothetical protein